MGNTCAPDQHEYDVVRDMEPSERITAIINRYQAENQRMEKELEELKSESAESRQAHVEKTKQNLKLVQEMNLIKTLVSKKDRSLVRHLLEAALYSTATSLISEESISKKIIEGQLQKFGRAGKTKSKGKWVEMFLKCGQGNRNQFTKGHVMIVWADSKESKVSSRGRVIEVKEEASNVNRSLHGRTFSIVAIVKGEEKELVFTCDNEESKQSWLQACKESLAQIEEEEKYMTELFTLQIEFSKEKLGFRVEERLVEKKLIDDKIKNDSDQKEDKTVETEDVEHEEDCEKAVKATLKAEEKTEETVEDKKISEDKNEKHDIVEIGSGNNFTKTEGKPCELLVTSISDPELLSKGLILYSTVRKINEVALEGMSFAEQVNILTTTDKPFVLTFTGPVYLKKSTSGYSSILKDLVAEGENTIKSLFYTMVQGTVIEEELKAYGKDCATPIKELLSNRGRLVTLLQNLKDCEEEL